MGVIALVLDFRQSFENCSSAIVQLEFTVGAKFNPEAIRIVAVEGFILPLCCRWSSPGSSVVMGVLSLPLKRRGLG